MCGSSACSGKRVLRCTACRSRCKCWHGSSCVQAAWRCNECAASETVRRRAEHDASPLHAARRGAAAQRGDIRLAVAAEGHRLVNTLLAGNSTAAHADRILIMRAVWRYLCCCNLGRCSREACQIFRQSQNCGESQCATTDRLAVAMRQKCLRACT